LRPDHLGIFGYERETSPRIDAVFEDGVVFERAYSVEANTPPSIMALLSGLPPRGPGVEAVGEVPEDRKGRQLVKPKINPRLRNRAVE
jgi:arylsulfatase A-like enzyme